MEKKEDDDDDDDDEEEKCCLHSIINISLRTVSQCRSIHENK